VKHSTLSILALALCLSGCAVSGKHSVAKADPVGPSATEDLTNVPTPKVNDPFERFNRTMFRFNDTLTRIALRPFGYRYAKIVPRPVRTGVSNFFDNLQYPVRFVNSVLQGKIKRSAQETGKFVVNTTAGLGGLIRVSDHISSLAEVPPEDFGLTLGVWGISPGPFIVIPVLGPSDCRDAVGFAGDFAMSPLNWASPLGIIWYPYSQTIGTALSGTRYANGVPKAVEDYDELTSAAVDPYIAVRNAYLSYRANQLKK
jgi:phospholipid-binding lipoprotein MlaA